MPSAAVYGQTRGVAGLPDGVPIAGIAGDQQAALFGQACFEPGDAKCTYGTGAFLLMNVGERPIISRNRLLGTVAWTIGEKTWYALEGSVFVAGALVQWLRDGLGIIGAARDIEPLAASVPDSGGVLIVRWIELRTPTQLLNSILRKLGVFEPETLLYSCPYVLQASPLAHNDKKTAFHKPSRRCRAGIRPDYSA